MSNCRKRWVGFVVGMVATIFVTTGGTAKPAFAEKTSEADAVRASNAAFYAALSARDIDAFMKVWSAKSEVRHIGPRNKDVDVGLEAIKKNLQGIFETFPELKVTPQQVQIRIVGAVAWVSDIEDTERKNRAGETLIASNFGTSIFEKQGGKWVMVHHHSSVIPR
jgi:ketosteroid isomerase-like protein